MDRIGSGSRCAVLGWFVMGGLLLTTALSSPGAAWAGGAPGGLPDLCSASLAEGPAGAISGGGDPGEPSSRVTVGGRFRTDFRDQKNFFLGAPDSLNPWGSNRDRFVTQELALFPRFVLTDNLNLTTALSVQSIWGWNLDTPDTARTRTTDRFFRRNVSSRVRLDWAYLSYRNVPTGTRWYLGRQKFGPGNLLVLDADASGIQAYKDLPGLNSSLGAGYAVLNEWSDILIGGNPERADSTVPRPGDAGVFFAEWKWKSGSGTSVLNPFFLSYDDKSSAIDVRVDSATVYQQGAAYLPDRQGYLEARFRPQISSATVVGVQGKFERGDIALNFEYDMLKGKDEIRNRDFGPDAVHDVNNGDLKGMNVYVDLDFTPGPFLFGGAVAMGSGDDEVRSGEGNINYLANQGHFSLLEIWGSGLALNERGIAPEGLGNPYTRAYRGLENTRIFQGRAGYAFRPNLKAGVVYGMIRAAKDVRPFYTDPTTGLVTPATYGRPKPRDEGGVAASDRALGSEIDVWVDWTIDPKLTLFVRGARFSPGAAAGFLINGNGTWQESVTQLRLGVEVPIREFSIGS